jgi:hypothetical protein
MRKFVQEELPEQHPLFRIVKTKAIDMQYHAWFDWDKRQANKFFRMFGDGFSNFMQPKLTENPQLEKAIAAFLEIGDLRNRMVHQNFATFTLEKTLEEVYSLYRDAAPFVYTVYGCLVEYCRTLSSVSGR